MAQKVAQLSDCDQANSVLGAKTSSIDYTRKSKCEQDLSQWTGHSFLVGLLDRMVAPECACKVASPQTSVSEHTRMSIFTFGDIVAYRGLRWLVYLI
jgi:hypothetical protein